MAAKLYEGKCFRGYLSSEGKKGDFFEFFSPHSRTNMGTEELTTTTILSQ